jgi:type I restriction enzyme, S subunit
MEVRSGYKRTEVGVIPEDWEVRPIREIARVKGGKRLPLGAKLTEKPTAHPYIRVTDMKPGGVDDRRILFVPDAAYSAIQNYRIFTSDIFISVAGSIGITGVVPASLNGANLTENADRITEIETDRDYLLHALGAFRIQSLINGVRTAGAQPKLALNQIEAFKVALPPSKKEQARIAEALTDADALLASLDRLLAKKRDLKQAAMQQLLLGRRRLPGFSERWSIKRLGDVLSIHHGKNQKAVEMEGGQYPILASGGEIGRASAYLYDRPSVLIGRKGTIDKPRFTEAPFWAVDTLFYSILLGDSHAKFYYYRLCLVEWPTQ